MILTFSGCEATAIFTCDAGIPASAGVQVFTGQQANDVIQGSGLGFEGFQGRGEPPHGNPSFVYDDADGEDGRALVDFDAGLHTAHDVQPDVFDVFG